MGRRLHHIFNSTNMSNIKVWTGRLQLLSAFSETSGADDVPTRSISVRIRRKNGVCFHVRRPIEVWVNAVREFPEPKLRHSQFGALLPCRRDGMPTTRSILNGNAETFTSCIVRIRDRD